MNKRSKLELICFAAIVAGAVLGLIIGANGQPPPPINAKPQKVADQTPVVVNPPLEQIGGKYWKIYRNSQGVVFKREEFTAGGAHLATTNVEEIYAPGYPAKEVTVTGAKNVATGDITATKQEEVYKDPRGKVLKTETFTGFGPDGVATSKVVTANGVKTAFTFDPATNTWVPVNAAPAAPPKPKPKTDLPPLALAVDRCIVGKWTALPANFSGGIGEGLIFRTGGLSLTVEADGTTVFDFSKIPAYVYPSGDEIIEMRATGRRSARVKTTKLKDGTLFMATSDVPHLSVVVRTSSNRNGIISEDKPNFFFPMSSSYGVGVGEETVYTCNASTLVLANGGLTFKKATE